MIFNTENNINNCLKHVESFTFYENGTLKTVDKLNDKYNKIKNKIFCLFNDSRVMPAFGVSIHSETVKAMESDFWLEFNFSTTLEINGLSFDSLLFKLEATSGLNLIRKNNNKYDGRCIYLDLETFTDLKEILEI